MMVGRVRGTVTATIRHPGLDGHRLLLVELLDADGAGTGRELLAVDTAGTGVGETVLLLDEGNGARQILGRGGLPIRTVVVGSVDAVRREA
ncbi:MAG TPA: EutN/CcmL family microcompartment protein [Candidatus Krumholzibacteria bacterium]|nr:EutN/CcmL family microcompartment protein [Candidatus Krumholzibacteria bacterium]HRX51032.1 EutN/CcmL family microcompartment protein [Candidatus Krumholzibacteria bacterium]